MVALPHGARQCPCSFKTQHGTWFQYWDPDTHQSDGGKVKLRRAPSSAAWPVSEASGERIEKITSAKQKAMPSAKSK